MLNSEVGKAIKNTREKKATADAGVPEDVFNCWEKTVSD
jgi:hypothetical protein